MEAFTSNLRRFREEKNFSTNQMSLLLEMTEESYHELENGLSSPSVPVVKLLSHIFKTPVPELISHHHLQKAAPKTPGGHFSPELLSDSDKDTYIRILENQLRVLLTEKERTS